MSPRVCWRQFVKDTPQIEFHSDFLVEQCKDGGLCEDSKILRAPSECWYTAQGESVDEAFVV